MAQTLQEYLVELGFNVDKRTLKGFHDALDSADKKTESFAKRTANNMRTATVAITGLFTGIATAAAKMFSSYADLDTAAERQARQWWMTEENARSLTDALDAMGESFDDIYTMTPEQYQNMLELKNFSSSIRAPAELQSTLNVIKEAQQEVRKLKVLFREAGNWIIYYFAKFMGGDTQKLINSFKSFVEYLTQKMPQATQFIARLLYYVYRLGKAGIEMAGRLKEALGNLFDSMPTKTKVAGAAITGFIALFKAGPVGIFIAAIAALLLLMDDYLTWERGGRSALPGLWEGLADLKENPTMQKYLDLLRDIVDAAVDLGEAVGDIVIEFVKIGDEMGIWEVLGEALKTALDTVTKILNATKRIQRIWNSDEYKGMSAEEAIAAAKQEDIDNGGDGNLSWWKLELVRQEWENANAADDALKFGFRGSVLPTEDKYLEWQQAYDNRDNVAAAATTGTRSTTYNTSNESTKNITINQSIAASTTSSGTTIARESALRIRSFLD